MGIKVKCKTARNALFDLLCAVSVFSMSLWLTKLEPNHGDTENTETAQRSRSLRSISFAASPERTERNASELVADLRGSSAADVRCVLHPPARRKPNRQASLQCLHQVRLHPSRRYRNPCPRAF